MSEEELRKYYSTYTECWKFFRKFCDPVDTDEFWERVIAESDALYQAEPTEFRKQMLINTIDEIERVLKQKTKEK